MISQPIISVRSLTKRFASTLALNQVDFEIRAGEVHALVGENGAGKSTLINLLAGELQPDAGVRAYSEKQRAGTLSGGNQQKVILARGLARRPRLLLLHEPTRGIDVGAKAEIYEILGRLAASGVSILVVSSELPELIGQCDRILAMHAGRITGEFNRADATAERILAGAMGNHLANSH